MKRVLIIALVLTAMSTAVPSPAAAPAQALPPHQPNHVLVRFAPGTSAAQRAAVHTRLGGTVVNHVEQIALDVVRVSLPAREAVARYRAIDDVAYAQLNWILAREPNEARSAATTSSDEFPDDPGFSHQWSLHNDGTTDAYYPEDHLFGSPKPDFDMDVPEGWKLLSPTSDREPVRVAILDTGIDRAEPINPDLVNANVVACAEAISGDGTLVDGQCNDGPSDGTAMAGIIAAERNNGIGIAGLMPEAELAIGKFIEPTTESSTMADYLRMIVWAAEVEADVIVFHVATLFCSPDEAERAALLAAHNAGALIVAGSGTSGDCIGPPDAKRYPASYEFVLSTGATEARGRVWMNNYYRVFFSSCNEATDIMAPGEFVYTTDAAESQFSHWSGMTPATSHVAGVAALLMSEGATAAEAREAMLATTTPVDQHPLRPGACAGLGQVNLEGALKALAS